MNRRRAMPDPFAPRRDHPLPFGAPIDDIDSPALGLIEVASIAVGVLVSDAVVKQAPVELLEAAAVTPGKFLVLFAGAEAAVEESFRRGLEICPDDLLDRLLIPNIHPLVVEAAAGLTPEKPLESVAVLEYSTAAASIVGADRAVKAAEVSLIKLRLSRGIGGKGFFILNGDLNEIEAAVEAGAQAAEKEGTLVSKVIIANPHGDLLRHLAAG